MFVGGRKASRWISSRVALQRSFLPSLSVAHTHTLWTHVPFRYMIGGAPAEGAPTRMAAVEAAIARVESQIEDACRRLDDARDAESTSYYRGEVTALRKEKEDLRQIEILRLQQGVPAPAPAHKFGGALVLGGCWRDVDKSDTTFLPLRRG